MKRYSIEIHRDIEYRYCNNRDMFLVLKLSEMRFYDDELRMIRKSQFSANSNTSLVFNLDDCDKSIGKVGEMDDLEETAFKKCIKEINSAIKDNRVVNEKLLHTSDIPLLRYEDFKTLKLTRIMKFHWRMDSDTHYSANIYINDDNGKTKTFLFDGSSELHNALNDDEIIRECYDAYAQGKANDKIWEKREIRKHLYYPTIEDMY